MSGKSNDATNSVPVESLIDALTTNHAREPFERESQLRWDSSTDTVDVHTAERSLMRRFLHHPEFELEWVSVRSGNRRSRRVSADDLVDGWDDEDVLSVTGTLPIGCVGVKSERRTSGGHAAVVSRRVLDDE